MVLLGCMELLVRLEIWGNLVGSREQIILWPRMMVYVHNYLTRVLLQVDVCKSPIRSGSLVLRFTRSLRFILEILSLNYQFQEQGLFLYLFILVLEVGEVVVP